MKKTFCSDKGM